MGAGSEWRRSRSASRCLHTHFGGPNYYCPYGRSRRRTWVGYSTGSTNLTATVCQSGSLLRSGSYSHVCRRSHHEGIYSPTANGSDRSKPGNSWSCSRGDQFPRQHLFSEQLEYPLEEAIFLAPAFTTVRIRSRVFLKRRGVAPRLSSTHCGCALMAMFRCTRRRRAAVRS